MSVWKHKNVAGSITLVLLGLSTIACNKTDTIPEAESEPRPDISAPRPDISEPRPDLTPEQVIKLQLEAIRDSEGTDAGFAVAYRYASPGQKRRMGTLERFAEIMRGSEFQAMLDFQAAEYGLTRIEGNRARQIVTLENDEGRVQMFLFELQKQESGPDKDCWLTDAVHPSTMNAIQPDAYSNNQS